MLNYLNLILLAFILNKIFNVNVFRHQYVDLIKINARLLRVGQQLKWFSSASNLESCISIVNHATVVPFLLARELLKPSTLTVLVAASTTGRLNVFSTRVLAVSVEKPILSLIQSNSGKFESIARATSANSSYSI